MSRYNNTRTSKSKSNEKRPRTFSKYNTTIYQSIPERNDDIFLITTEGDRLDLLAHQYYKDPNLWWYIAQANNLKTMNLEPGLSIRIPVSTEYAKGL